MQIDWFTFFAQILNFIILLFLLRRFLFRPIMEAMAAREERLAAEFAAAEEQQRAAVHVQESYQAQLAELEETREQLLDQATQEADQRRKTLFREARNEVETMLGRWYDSIEHEQARFLQTVRHRLGMESCRIARMALADLADAELEAAVARCFARRLIDLPAEQRRGLILSGGGFAQDVVVRSAGQLDGPTRQVVVDALQALLEAEDRANGLQGRVRMPQEIDVHFEVDPDLLCGVELQVRDRRVGWSLDDYMDDLEEEIAHVMDAELEPG